MDDDRQAVTLQGLIAYVEELRARYHLVPVTAAEAHLRFARMAPLYGAGPLG